MADEFEIQDEEDKTLAIDADEGGGETGAAEASEDAEGGETVETGG